MFDLKTGSVFLRSPIFQKSTGQNLIGEPYDQSRGLDLVLQRNIQRLEPQMTQYYG